ncbi:MAG: YraN family protein [Gammaproteobacteria bacterium]|jgi:putative endonuclease|nr:YraN family protein [Gammaproteobacteria bacterium]
MRGSTPGQRAEDAACAYLLARGLRLIARNFRCRRGEIDLIMQDTDNLVFVEVRYRRQSRYGSGLESVDRRKQERIVRCAMHYLQRHPQAARSAARFDVVALAPASEGLRIDWVRNAFDAGP